MKGFHERDDGGEQRISACKGVLRKTLSQKMKGKDLINYGLESD